MPEPRLRVTAESQFARLSARALEILRELENFEKEMQAVGIDLPLQVLDGLQYLAGALRQIEKDVDRLRQEGRNLQALAEISQMVNSTLNVDEVLQETMDTIIRLTGAERAFLMLRSPEGQMDTVQARNWDKTNLAAEEVEISTTIVDWVLTHGEAVLTHNAAQDARFGRQESVVTYNLRSILCVPLKVKGELIGVIYADNRVQEGLFSDHEREVLSDFANQAAVAIENARLYEELSGAYEQTLQSLAAALDARDRETEGHSRRVVHYALAIARQIGLSEDEMGHLRRGALLHDIGKIGVPDAILRKDGPLTESEWSAMHEHPEYAKRMLADIPFLAPAVEIIYTHQERFDGNGYPSGLSGEAIPLGSRIFAVADAYDAITSHRPYRPAQPYEVAREEIARGSGSQFDPQVVEAFLAIPEGEWLDITSRRIE